MRQIKLLPGYFAGILPLLMLMHSASGDSAGVIRKMKAVRPYREPVQVAKHRERIQKIYAAQDEKLKKAEALQKEKKFKEAVELCENVLGELELELSSVKNHTASTRADAVRQQIASIKAAWSQELLRNARLAAADKRFDDTIALATQAVGTSTLYSEEANALIDFARGMKRVNKKTSDTSMKTFAPNHEKEKAKFKRLLEEARVYYRNGRLTEAREVIEQAFVINPYDSTAIALAGEIYRSLYLAGSDRRKTDIAAMMAYAAWQWSEPTFNLVPPNTIPNAIKRSIGAESEKLKSIRFAGFHFDDADLSAVLTYIQDRSKEGDPEKDERFKGVTVGHMLTPELVEKIRVTLSLDNVSLASVLECLSLVTGLKYEVSTRNGFTNINFAPQANEMITHEWDAPRNFMRVVTGKESGTAGENMNLGEGGGGGGGNEGGGNNEAPAVLSVGENSESSGSENFNLTEGLAARRPVDISSEELKTYFSDRGVPFPPGSSIYYSPRTQKILVTNTRDAIFKLDERLDQIAASEKPLVMIEIKAIEISEVDYQDLGFDWTLGSLGSNNMDMVYGSLKSGSSGWMLGPGVNTLPGGGFSTIRGGTSKNDTKSAIVNNWNIFPSLFGSKNPFGSDIPLNISLTINALSRSDRTETLSAPKLVTQDGMTATVKMMTTYYFPESWEELEVEVTTSGDSGPVTRISPPVPEFNEEGQELGIYFSAVPRIRKNRDINLDLHIELTSYVGPDNYQITIYGENRYYKSELIDGVLTPRLVAEAANYNFTVWRPIISDRKLTTNVDISDGETLVLGGMVENHSFIRVDKVPILGDLPLIGRFFQSQAENTERANLLLFVSARLIDDHGMPIKRHRLNALPEYNR